MEEAAQEAPAARGDDDDMEQATPQVTSNSAPYAPGAPVKKKSRLSATGNLKPKKLVYSDAAQEQAKKLTQQLGESLHLSQEMQHLLKTRISTTEGIWVQCDYPDCNKWRYLADVIDPTELPEKWYCSMNKDLKHSSCEAEEDDQPDDLLEAKYFVGSIVWAKVNTYPWWPAMIDDDPDLGIYEWRERSNTLPTDYHVVFLDQKVTRAWVRDSNCMAFLLACNHDGPAKNKVPGHFRKAFNAAVETAGLAVKLPVAERIKIYCFANRYPDTCKTLPKASKGAKRPRERSRANQESEKEEPACLHVKQPKETLGLMSTAQGKPRKMNKSVADTIPSQGSQGAKRPRGRPRKNASTEDNQPACATPKQPRKSFKQDPNSGYGATAQSTCKNTLSKQAALPKKAKRPTSAPLYTQSVNTFQGTQGTFKTKTKKTGAIASLPPTATGAPSSTEYALQDSERTAGQIQAGPQTKGNNNAAEMFSSASDSKYRGTAQCARKKTPSKLAAPAKQVVQPGARDMKSTLPSKRGIKGAQKVQEKHSINANKGNAPFTSLPATTMASSNTKVVAQDFDEPVSHMQGDQSKRDDNIVTPFERNLSQFVENKGAVLSEVAVMTMDSTNSKSMLVTPQSPTFTENGQQNLLDAAPMLPKDAQKDNPMPSDMMHISTENITTHHTADADTAPAGAQGVGPTTPLHSATYSYSSNGIVEISTEAKQGLTTPLFGDDAVAPQPERFPDVDLIIDFLDSNVTTHYKPNLSSLSKGAEAVCTNERDKPLLPREVTDLKTAPTKVSCGKSTHGSDLQGHGTATPSATASKSPPAIHCEPKLTGLNRADKPLLPNKVMGLEAAADMVPTEKATQAIGSRSQIHGATIPSVNATNKSSKVKKPNQALPGENSVTHSIGTASSTCAAPIRKTGMSESNVPTSDNDKVDTVAKKKTSSSLNKQSSKPRKQPVPENKENTDRPVKPQATLSTATSAKARKTTPKQNRPSTTSVVSDNVSKKPSFKVPVKDKSAAKMEAKLQAALASVVANVANVASANKPADSEDSDFDSLSNTQELTFEDVLSSISHSMSQGHESDFVSLEEVDGSQTFSTTE